jgi:hypothetical protein
MLSSATYPVVDEILNSLMAVKIHRKKVEIVLLLDNRCSIHTLIFATYVLNALINIIYSASVALK